MSLTRTLACAGASVIALACAGAVHAQTAAPTGPEAQEGNRVEEVIVTAQRRAENIEKVPLAVTALSTTELATSQVVSTLDVARLVPNMFASNNVGQGSANVYYIRGLGQTQSFPTFEPQVSTYVDDIYVARQNANNFSLFGVQQVQVLRGPQGTLFGRNSTGGAILVSLQKPGDTFGGDASVSYGSWNRVIGQLSVDMPLSEQFETRTSVFGIHDDGYVEDLTTHQTLNYQHDWGVREAFRIRPASMSNVEWNISADYSDNNNANLLNQPGPGGAHGSDRVSYSGWTTQGGALEPFLTGEKSKLGQGVDVKSYGVASDIRIGLGSGTLDLITGYRGLQQATGADFPDLALGAAIPADTFPTGQFALAQELRSTQWSQEVKWNGQMGDRLNYTAGAFWLAETNGNDFGAVANIGPLFGFPYFPFTLGDEHEKNDTKSVAGYLQGDFRATDQLTLTVGGRFTHEVKDLWVTPNTPGGFGTADILAAGYKTHLVANEFTPRFAIQYQADPTLMLFASATRGFQGGGWNGLAFNAATYNDFGPETVWTFEGGLRKDTDDHRLRFNATAFYTLVKDYQLLSDNTAAASFVTTNAADLKSYGVETDLTWQPINDFRLSIDFGLIHANYYNPSPLIQAQQAACRASPGVSNGACGSGIVNAAGDLAEPTYAPTASGSITASYDLHFGDFILTPTAAVQAQSREAVGTEGLPLSFAKSRALLDASLQLRPANGRWTLTAECKNCTTVNYPTTYLFGYQYYNIPGTWDVRLGVHF